MKKLLATIITAILLLSTCIIAAFPTQAEDINWDDWIFDGQGELVAYYGTDANVVVPSQDQDGNPTVSIGDKAFESNEDITSVVVPEGVTKIGSGCFQYCKNLSEASLPYSLRKAGGQIFRYAAITSIVVPPIKAIRMDFVVAQGVSCTDIILTPGIEEINSAAFYAAFTEIIIPKSVLAVDWGFYMSFVSKSDDIDIYILNPETVLGRVVEGQEAGFGTKRLAEESKTYDYKTEGAQIVYNHNGGGSPRIKIHALKESTAKAHTERFLKSKNGFFVEMTEEEVAEKENFCKENGVQKPSETQKNPTTSGDNTTGGDDTTGGSSNTTGGSNNTTGGSNNTTGGNKNTNTTTTTTTTTDNSGLIIIIAAVFGGIFLLIVIGLVVALVIINSKKKKKKAKKVAKAAAVEAPVEVAPVEEAPVEEAPVEDEE